MPPRGDELITFDSSDNLHSAMAKLDSAGNSFPAVFLAPGCQIADNVLTYRLLARTSERHAAPLAVVARNPLWRQMAREHGLRAYANVGSLRRARRRSFFAFPERLADSLLSSLLPSLAGWGWLVAVALLLAAALGTYFLAPVIRVTMHTPVELIAREVTVRADVGSSAIDAAARVIPARIIEHRFGIADFVDTTGEKKVGKEKAKGEVTIINSSPGAVLLPAGTILSTASGVRFSTPQQATIGPFGQSATASPTPGRTPTTPTVPATAATPTATRPAATMAAASPTSASPTAVPTAGVPGVIVRVPVVAVDPGEKGNVPALAISKIEGDAFRGLTVLNEQALSGGTDEKARSASADDRSRLKEALFQRAQSQSLSELTLRVRQSESLIPHSLQVRIEGEEYDKAVDEVGDRLRGTAYVVATGIAFANQDINSVVEREWKQTLPTGYRALAGALNLTPPEVLQAGPRTASMKMKATGRAERVVEADQLTQELRGMSISEVTSRLARLDSSLRAVKVEIWPSWATRAYRIEVETVQ